MTALHGTGPLVRLIIGRDRIRLLAWMAGILLLVVTTAASTKGIYATQADLDEAALASRDNPAALAFNGPTRPSTPSAARWPSRSARSAW